MVFAARDSSSPNEIKKGPFSGILEIFTTYFWGSLCKSHIIVGIIRMGPEISNFQDSSLYIHLFAEHPSHKYLSNSLEAEYTSSEVTMGIQLSMNKVQLLQIELSIGTDSTYGQETMKWRGEKVISPPAP